MGYTKIIRFLFMALLLLWHSTLFSKTVIGSIVKMRGGVFKLGKAKQEIEVKAGADIFLGETLITKKRSFVKLLMSDESILQLGPESYFKIESYSLKGPSKKISYRLAIGKMRGLFKKLEKKGKKIRIITPTASMGIRGTEVLADVFKVDGQFRTDFALLSGEVEIFLPQIGKTPGKTFALKKGEVFEAQGIIEGERPAPAIKRLSPRLEKILITPPSRGGKTFLFDARDRRSDFDNIKFDSPLKRKKGQGKKKKTKKVNPTFNKRGANLNKINLPSVFKKVPKRKQSELEKNLGIVKGAKTGKQDKTDDQKRSLENQRLQNSKQNQRIGKRKGQKIKSAVEGRIKNVSRKKVKAVQKRDRNVTKKRALKRRKAIREKLLQNKQPSPK